MPAADIITVTFNPAIDRVLEAPSLKLGEHAKVRRLARYPAGKGINVSRALARIGRASIATGFVGEGEAGDFARYIEAGGVARSELVPVRGETRENITLLDPVTTTDTHLREEGFEIGEGDVNRLAQTLDRLVARESVVVFSGSLPRGMTASQVGDIGATVVRRRGRLALDLAGSVTRSLLAAGVRPWLIKPNASELAELVEAEGLDEPSLARRVDWLAVSLGPQGVRLYHDGQAWHGRADIAGLPVVNTVGCGDCLVAGLVDSLSRDSDPAEALRQGIGLATANLFQPGVAAFSPQHAGFWRQATQVSRLPVYDDRA
jgi:1-phosphofructokinase family hexose kinase